MTDSHTTEPMPPPGWEAEYRHRDNKLLWWEPELEDEKHPLARAHIVFWDDDPKVYVSADNGADGGLEMTPDEADAYAERIKEAASIVRRLSGG